MAAAGADGAVLEQSRRRLALIGAGLLLLAILLLLSRPGATTPVERAYPIPGEHGRLQVEVLNGSGRSGLARTATRVLRRGGLDVMFYGTADGDPIDSTRLLVRRGDSTAAERTARLLGTGRITWAPDSTRRVDVTVILGADYRPPEEIHP